MKNLIKPVDYAAKVGISRQAVYAKIKKGILPSKNIDGKIYIVLDEIRDTSAHEPEQTSSLSQASETESVPSGAATAPATQLLRAKDETITVLKENVKDLKETNRMITSTLRSEVELLKDAFGEMKMLYHKRIEQIEREHPIDVDNIREEDTDVQVEWQTLEEFYEQQEITKSKKRKKIAKALKKQYKKGDVRLDKYDDEIVLLADANYSDILKGTSNNR